MLTLRSGREDISPGSFEEWWQGQTLKLGAVAVELICRRAATRSRETRRALSGRAIFMFISGRVQEKIIRVVIIVIIGWITNAMAMVSLLRDMLW